MRLALLISLATAGLASKVCGSVFGLLRMAVAWTYLPPICWITLAYSFSAPMAWMLPVPPVPPVLPPAVAEEQAVANTAVAAASASDSAAVRATERVRMVSGTPGSHGGRGQVQVNTVMVIVVIKAMQVVLGSAGAQPAGTITVTCQSCCGGRHLCASGRCRHWASVHEVSRAVPGLTTLNTARAGRLD